MKRVLVVDDEPHMARVLKLYLERAGYAVEICVNGQEALSAVRNIAPDALITDIQMPLMSGKELCLALQQYCPERGFPIYVMTSRTEREERDWTAAIPNLEFLEKPISMRSIVAKLERHFAAGTATVGGPDA
jgi:DNA-binding response OmpR family regulator